MKRICSAVAYSTTALYITYYNIPRLLKPYKTRQHNFFEKKVYERFSGTSPKIEIFWNVISMGSMYQWCRHFTPVYILSKHVESLNQCLFNVETHGWSPIYQCCLDVLFPEHDLIPSPM